MKYTDKLKSIDSNGIGLCIGLDPVIEKLPDILKDEKKSILKFNNEIINATKDYAAAYKPNLAFYEACGVSGWEQLEETIGLIPQDKLIIADAKRGDIGNTAKAYAAAIFDSLRADAVTVNPYLGSDSIIPFIDRDDKGIFLLAVTSNRSGKEIQQLVAEGESIYMHVIRMASRLNSRQNIGLVVGATHPEELETILPSALDMPLLIPGVGAQGGDIETLRNALTGHTGVKLVNSSRGIIYASGESDFAEAAANEAEKLSELLND